MIEAVRSRRVTIICLVCGLVLLAMTWHPTGAHPSYDLKGVIFGPILIAIGIGLAIHGESMPVRGYSHPVRIYGFLGSLIGIGQLWFLGFFNPRAHDAVERGLGAAMAVAILSIWFLPDRMWGGARQREQPRRVANRPIEPR